MYVDCLLYKLSWCQGLESWDEARCKQFLHLVVAKHVDSCAVAVFSVAVRRLAVTAAGFSVSLFVSLPLFGKYPVIFFVSYNYLFYNILRLSTRLVILFLLKKVSLGFGSYCKSQYFCTRFPGRTGW